MSHRHCEPTGRANARPMTGSAKQPSFLFAALKLDCFVALAPRNDGSGCLKIKSEALSDCHHPRKRVIQYAAASRL
jgi:hypothetical protein